MADAGAKGCGPITFSGELRSMLREAQEKDEPCRTLMRQERGASGGQTRACAGGELSPGARRGSGVRSSAGLG
eukprot:5111300-Alexandrium_andersonii.AAC.1